MSKIHPRRQRAQELLIGVFRDLNQKDPNYFKKYNKYGINIEKSIYNQAIKESKLKQEVISWDNIKFGMTYATIARRVKANLTYTRAAPELLDRLRNKEILPTDIASMKPWEMSPKFNKELQLKIDEHIYNSNEVYQRKSEGKKDGMFQCGKCRSYDIDTKQAQTRSADEPMTVFLTCNNCGKKWKQ